MRETVKVKIDGISSAGFVLFSGGAKMLLPDFWRRQLGITGPGVLSYTPDGEAREAEGVEVEIGTIQHDSSRAFHVVYTGSDQGTMSPDMLRALKIRPGRYLVRAQRLPEKRKSRPWRVKVDAGGSVMCSDCHHVQYITDRCECCGVLFGEPQDLPPAAEVSHA